MRRLLYLMWGGLTGCVTTLGGGLDPSESEFQSDEPVEIYLVTRLPLAADPEGWEPSYYEELDEYVEAWVTTEAGDDPVDLTATWGIELVDDPDLLFEDDGYAVAAAIIGSRAPGTTTREEAWGGVAVRAVALGYSFWDAIVVLGAGAVPVGYAGYCLHQIANRRFCIDPAFVESIDLQSIGLEILERLRNPAFLRAYSDAGRDTLLLAEDAQAAVQVTFTRTQADERQCRSYCDQISTLGAPACQELCGMKCSDWLEAVRAVAPTWSSAALEAIGHMLFEFCFDAFDNQH
jgi:hypothetical protein